MSRAAYERVLRGVARRVVPAGLRRAVRERWRVASGEHALAAALGCEVLSAAPPVALQRGWRGREVAERQQEAIAPLLERMRAGQPRQDFLALAEAVRSTGAADPLVVEVGCGSGWNAEVLSRLAGLSFRYLGVDYSAGMVGMGRRCYPSERFAVGDATALPLRDGSCDILLSGTVLMHVLDYAQAIRESRRVSRGWCIFHTVPVVRRRSTTVLRKLAYGSPVVEVVFNERHFLGLVAASGLRLRRVVESIPHDYLRPVLREPVPARTYVCEVA
ncbi:MAG: methyltransferase domain-containing protein [Gemmatimonadetes bacterium]|nr:methyltransferase domain-containing protein [Gemmatimonadota bacterium]